MVEKIERSEAEWKSVLTEEEFRVCRKKGTERAFAGEYWDCHEAGTYVCACCGTPLFDSGDKYDSGTGWPSFSQPKETENVAYAEDRSLFARRTEVLCAACDAHLGHVFDDGPVPTGKRYCMNSVSLRLEKTRDES